MKKVYFTLIFVSLLVNVACKFDKSNTDDPTENISQNDANAIIDYNNAVIDLTDNHYSYLSSIDQNLVKIEKGLENPDDRFAFMGLIMPITTPVSFRSGNPEEPTKALAEEDQDFFKTHIKSLKESFANVKSKYGELNDYLKAEDYKDDGGEKGRKLISDIDEQIASYYEENKIVNTKLAEIADDAEKTILQIHPLKDYIFAFKDDSKAIAKFIEIAYKNPNEYHSIEADLNAAYKKIERLNNEHSAMETPEVEGYHHAANGFQSFNKAVNNFLIDARKIMREASTTGEFTERNLSTFEQNQEAVRRAYNNFVD